MIGNLPESLPIWIKSRPLDEPAYAFLARSLEANEVASPGSFYSTLGYRAGGLTAIPIDTISKLTKHPIQELMDATPTGRRDEMSVQGEILSFKQYTTKIRRWCPDCLCEDAYHRFIWDVRSVTCCPRHQVRLNALCGCGEPVRWRTSFTALSHCGCELDDVDPPTDNPSEYEVRFAQYVSGRLNASGKIKDPVYDDLDLMTAIHSTESLGRFRLTPGSSIKSCIDAHGQALVVSAGYQVAHDPDEYEALLDAVVKSGRVGGMANWGLMAAYGEFRQWITTLPEKSALKKRLHDGMLKHAKENGIVIHTSTVDGGGKRVELDRLTLLEAAKICRVSHKRLKEVAVRLGFLEYEYGSGLPVNLTREQVREISVRLQDRITAKELAEQLGIERHAVERLRKEGLIKCFGEDVGLDVKSQGSQVWNSYSPNVATKLIALVASFLKVSDAEDLSTISIAAKDTRVSVSRIIGYLSSGQLFVRSAHQSQHGLNQFLVSRSELRRLSCNDHEAGMTLRQAGRDLNFHHQTLWKMRERGLIEVTIFPGSYRISTEELERIRALYIVSNEIIKKYDVPKHGVAVGHLVDKLGVSPALKRPEFQQVVYFREDIDAALKNYSHSSTVPSLESPLNIEAAAKALHISSLKFCYALIRTGMLKAERKDGSLLIYPEHLKAFKSCYVTSTELVLEWGVGRSHKVVELLALEGVDPICTLQTHGGILFDRLAIANAMSEVVPANNFNS